MVTEFTYQQLFDSLFKTFPDGKIDSHSSPGLLTPGILSHQRGEAIARAVGRLHPKLSVGLPSAPLSPCGPVATIILACFFPALRFASCKGAAGNPL